jgi:hypothetical protein
MRDLQVETTWYLPCNCGQYCTIWELVREGEEYYDEDMGGEQYHVATGEVISDEDLCTRELIVNQDFIRILEDHSGLKADCGLPPALCAELGRILSLYEKGELEGESDYEIHLQWNDGTGGWAVLDEGFLIVGCHYNELTIDIEDHLFAAFQQAFIAHGAEVLKEEA